MNNISNALICSPTERELPLKKNRRSLFSKGSILSILLFLLLTCIHTRSIAQSLTNVALHKPVTVSSTESGNYAGQMAVDGQAFTRWSSNFSDPQWIQVDLEAVFDIKQIVLSWETAASSAFRIEFSENGINWTTAATKNDLWNSPRTDNITVSGKARYVKVTGTTRTTQWGHSIYELQIFGTTATQTAVTGISVTSDNSTINLNKTTQLNAVIAPSNASNKSVTYSSNNTAIAKVSSSGLITGTGVGKATISVRTVDGNFVANHTVTVSETSSYLAVANAGADISLVDTNSDGQETITLNGALSYVPNGTIVSYRWMRGTEQVATTVSATLSLLIGSYTFTLLVEDNLGNISTDDVQVNINSNNGSISFEGISTHFEAFGTPYGGCGVPEELLETPNYVALNVFDTPGFYGMFDRPIKGSDMQYIGEFNNGYNCGRWVEVTIGPDCDGTNDGHAGEPFCRGEGSQWVDDQYSGAKLYMIVGDACGDPNAWCRDSRFHLDIATHALNIFEKQDETVDDMYPLAFHNRKITWNYTKAPNYKGDIKIFFMQNAQFYWPAIMITHLENGIHSVEQFINNQWVLAERNSDMGQAFILKPGTAPFKIRVTDANDEYIQNGREYVFDYPAECNGNCASPATEACYIAIDSGKKGFGVLRDEYSFYMTAKMQMGNLFLSWKNAVAGKTKITVTDLNGRMVKNTDFQAKTNAESFGLGALKKGIYIISFINTHNEVNTLKLSVQ